jgi:hypothetical protein
MALENGCYQGLRDSDPSCTGNLDWKVSLLHLTSHCGMNQRGRRYRLFLVAVPYHIIELRARVVRVSFGSLVRSTISVDSVVLKNHREM